MHKKHNLLFLLTPLLIALITTSTMAGWGDAVKQVGSQYADDAATAAGLPYTPSEAMQGIKDILSLSTGSALETLGHSGGFLNDPAVSIPLPNSLKALGGNSSGLLKALNSAAETAVPSTGNIFLDAIEKLSIDNAPTLLGGGSDAITRFFESNSRDTIKSLVKPIVAQSVQSAGVDKYLSAMMATQQALSGAPFDPNDYVTDRALDGIFYVMSLKEKEIRSTSGVGTTELIQKLF